MKKLFFSLAIVLGLVACGPVSPPQTPQPPTAPVRTVVITARGNSELIPSTGRLWDDSGATVDCAFEQSRVVCHPSTQMNPGNGWHLGVTPDKGWLYTQRDFVSCLPENQECYPLQDLGEAHLAPVVTDPPLLDKQTLIRTAQENFGGIKLRGCGLHMDNLFDPFLLERWVNDRSCYERMMDEHARRNDNTVTVDPRAGYHGQNDIDVWHRPDVFVSFLRDVRQRTNAAGEHFRVRVFLGGDSHIEDMRAPGAYEHWQADVRALAAVAEPYVEFVVPCWECRHDNGWLSAKQYYDMLAFAGQQFPRAVHSVHLVAGSSAPSSWPCDPAQAGSCRSGEGPPDNDLDDPVRGNEPNAWPYMLDRGMVDEFLYQFNYDGEFRYWSTYPRNEDAAAWQETRGALGRWWDIVVRLGDDPWSQQTACAVPGFCGRRGWRQVPVKAWEFIYDFYWDRDPSTVNEEFLKDFCRRALALGAWGCGSASVRR